MINQQRARTLQQVRTTLSGAEVLSSAKNFFTRKSGIYSTFLETEGPTHLALRGLGGEELVIGVAEAPGGTHVTASSYMYDQQIARFLSSLPLTVDGVVA